LTQNTQTEHTSKSHLQFLFFEQTTNQKDMDFEVSTEMLHKVGIFVLVQALVFLILSNSSNLFSSTKSFSFRQLSSFRMRRMEAFLSDMPPGGEPSRMAVSHKME
jgi:hypothetical protein